MCGFGVLKFATTRSHYLSWCFPIQITVLFTNSITKLTECLSEGERGSPLQFPLSLPFLGGSGVGEPSACNMHTTREKANCVIGAELNVDPSPNGKKRLLNLLKSINKKILWGFLGMLSLESKSGIFIGQILAWPGILANYLFNLKMDFPEYIKFKSIIFCPQNVTGCANFCIGDD